MSWRQIAKKDLRILIRDRRTLVLLLVMPLVLIAILGFSAGRLFLERRAQKVSLALVDLSRSEVAAALTAALAEDPRLEIQPAATLDLGRKAISGVDQAAVVVIGAGFSQAVSNIEPIDLLDFPNGRLVQGLRGMDIQLHPSSRMPWVRSSLEQLVFYKTLQVVVPHTVDRWPMARALMKSLRRENPLPDAPPDAIEGFLHSGMLSSADTIYRFLVPSYAVLFAFFLVNLMGYSFVSERESGTLRRLSALPVSSPDLIFGKVLPFFGISVLQGILLLLLGRFLFEMPLGGAPWLLVPVVLATSAAATSLGLLVASLLKNPRQVTSFSTLLVIALAAVSGCLMPRSWMPQVLQEASLYFSPLSWALMAYSEALSSAPVAVDVLWFCTMELIFSAVFLGAALWKFGRASELISHKILP